jgi:hypothetical protein
MSRTLEIIAPALVAHFARTESSSLRRFSFEGIRLTQQPVPEHVKALVSESIRSSPSLGVDEETLIEWAAGRLSDAAQFALRRLLTRLDRDSEWSVVLELGAGQGNEVVRCPPPDLFKAIDSRIRGPADRDLTVFLPDRP